MKITGIIRKAIDYCKSISGEAARYIIIGVCTTLLNLALFTVLNEWLGWSTLAANLVAIPCAIAFAYVTNKLIVFRNRCDSKAALIAEFARFILARLFSMALEIGAVELAVGVMGQPGWLGKLESQVLVVITNYLLSKLLVFRRKRA